MTKTSYFILGPSILHTDMEDQNLNTDHMKNITSLYSTQAYILLCQLKM
jgi:hypothetical protein